MSTYLHREVYSHKGRIGVLVELSVETDFVARTDAFLEFARDIAMHIAAANPQTVAELLKQPFVRDESKDIGTVVRTLAEMVGEKISITRFVRWSDDPRPEDPVPPDSPAVAMRIRA